MQINIKYCVEKKDLDNLVIKEKVLKTFFAKAFDKDGSILHNHTASLMFQYLGSDSNLTMDETMIRECGLTGKAIECLSDLKNKML